MLFVVCGVTDVRHALFAVVQDVHAVSVQPISRLALSGCRHTGENHRTAARQNRHRGDSERGVVLRVQPILTSSPPPPRALYTAPWAQRCESYTACAAVCRAGDLLYSTHRLPASDSATSAANS